MSHLEFLPTKLEIEIFSHLNIPDIKAARAVSRKCRDNATPVLSAAWSHVRDTRRLEGSSKFRCTPFILATSKRSSSTDHVTTSS